MTQRQRNTPKKLSPEYLVGLTDGEGCFYTRVRPVRSKTQYHSVELHFYIKLKGDHLKLLEKVRDTFGCGAVYRQAESRETHSECYRFEINSRKDIEEVLIPLFDKYPLQGPKQESYAIFKKIARIVFSQRHRSRGWMNEVEELKKKMNLGARRVWKIRSLGGNVK
jgi:hypothetical protein